MSDKYALFLSGIITEEQYMNEGEQGLKNYMFFANLRTIKDCVDAMLSMDEKEVDSMLSDGHDWANDHIATSKDDVEEVCNWLKHRGKNPKKGKA